MATLVEISKRGPRLTPEQKAEQKRNRTQARVGLASNVLGLSAGAAATGAALRDPRFGEKGAGKFANKIYAAGKRIPQPIARLTRNVGPKGAAALAGGALALQAGNVGGDVVANRVLARSAKQGQKPVKKGLNLGKLVGTGKVTRTTHSADEMREFFDAAGKGRSVDNTGGWAVRTGGRFRGSGQFHFDDGENFLKVPARVSRRVGGGLTPAGKAVYVGGPAAAATGGAVVANNKRKVKKNDGSWTEIYVSKADHTGGHGSIEKAYRRYDPEADRQRRLGLVAGTGAGGGLLLGGAAAKNYTARLKDLQDKKVRGIAAKHGRGKHALLLTGGALASGGLGAAAYRRGLSERNNPWN